MALITCPACGNQVSENANACPRCGEPIRAARMSGEVDSGTESFSVEGKNRLELSAKADVQVKAISERLSSEGKTVVNVQRSDPQPFTLGVTVWKMDITIVWNASLDSQRYKQTLYNQARAYQSSGKYSQAVGIYKKIKGYSDVNTQIQQCQEKISQQNRVAAAAAAERYELQRNVGTNPSDTAKIVWLICGIGLFIGVLSFGMAGQYYENNKGMFWFGVILSVISLAGIIIRKVKISKYEAKVAEYKYSKK